MHTSLHSRPLVRPSPASFGAATGPGATGPGATGRGAAAGVSATASGGAGGVEGARASWTRFARTAEGPSGVRGESSLRTATRRKSFRRSAREAH